MKIFNQGRLVNGRYSSFKSALKRFIRSLVRLTVVAVIFISLAAYIGAQYFSSTVVATSQVEVAVDPAYPVLERIAQCESGGKHYGKSGQVVLNANSNDTVDVGKYQINSVWFAKATELGLDVTKEADNYTMAKWIYHNRGTGDWYASAKCWQR